MPLPQRAGYLAIAAAPVDLEVTVGGPPTFSGAAESSRVYPKIVVHNEVYVPPGTYEVLVRDRMRGLRRGVRLRPGTVANIDVMPDPGALVVDTDTVRDPKYLEILSRGRDLRPDDR